MVQVDLARRPVLARPADPGASAGEPRHRSAKPGGIGQACGDYVPRRDGSRAHLDGGTHDPARTGACLIVDIKSIQCLLSGEPISVGL
jgi:hypothetical protein